ncbi:MAG: phosphatase PAP2 family protein [bacterium]|nr:phosphatase PAP2 family protein [bacterium]
MREKNNGIVYNWNNVIISVVVISILTMLVIYMPNFGQFDGSITSVIRNFFGKFPVIIPTIASEIGNAYGIHWFWLEFAVVCALVTCNKYLKAFLFVFCVQATGFVNSLLKNFVCREHPYGTEYAGFSFPSSHASSVMCLFGILIYLTLRYVQNTFWRYVLVAVYGLFIFISVVSRLWLGMHYLSDVVVGLFLGFLFANLYIILLKSFQN